MAWETSDRLLRLPPDWKARVAEVWKRDGGRCTWRLPSGKRCPRPGAEVDHSRNNDDHSLSNLRLLCSHHHRQKTQKESLAGRMKWKKAPPRKKRQLRHPGEI